MGWEVLVEQGLERGERTKLGEAKNAVVKGEK